MFEYEYIKVYMNNRYDIPVLPLPYDLETKEVLKELANANRKLAELKGVAQTIPNEDILISSLTLQEAKDSSEVENIVTTQDELYKAGLQIKTQIANAATKEVLRYRESISSGFNLVRKNKLLTLNIIKNIQENLVDNNVGFRRTPGTFLQNDRKEIVYTPPQDKTEIENSMKNLEEFINDESMSNLDPLIKMAIIHHQFESIHPFYDGNGRTGRIINILYLVITGLIDLPILYLSRYITHNKSEYYRLIQAIRDRNTDNSKEWEAWIIFMLRGVEKTSSDTISLIHGISQLMDQDKQILRPIFKQSYKHELLNNLFFHPYTKIEYIEKDMMVQRKTATKYLDMIVETGILKKMKIGRENYYINTALAELFMNVNNEPAVKVDTIESVQR
ncbi:MAG: Fic family protein [Succinivibrionaceae bacterium]|jgi:Fic family protein|nr:Fic family protein [Pseudomonadota bacterium]MDY3145751.1 Fic family protein [Succinivibrionaceae bacterium]MDY6360913.1 Fic family protein [Lachnospiraceae bacterium]MDY6275627.1 Fic family protein [Succinivibrionaceae bacterium]MDY6336210.1 Fic family protein [Succinivibrionaceae bacterium]